MFERIMGERDTQRRLIARITAPLEHSGLGYNYLGDWSRRPDNGCLEKDLMRKNLLSRGYCEEEIIRALSQFSDGISVAGTTLYQANLKTYSHMRYGIAVQTEVGGAHRTVSLVDWQNPDYNDFAVAEEVTLKGNHERRPDIVIYLNGIAVAVIELKRSDVEVGDGIRQLISNQEEIFNPEFFATAQLLLAGNETQGLRYGTIGTPETQYLSWKADKLGLDRMHPNSGFEDSMMNILTKRRLLDLIQNFIIFDAGTKKIPRQHQYIGVKLAQKRLLKQEGGVIWHTQGSGKSIVMVLLIKWILEHDPDARALVITDRDELDKQIEEVMRNSGVVSADAPPPRVIRRDEFIGRLEGTTPRLICALIHKFDTASTDDYRPNVRGRFYVFVDECHRTQGGEMNRQMKRWLPGAIFIGFTGTPLLRRDRKTTRDVFGTFIHTYKFHEAVQDKVILDLKYEARNVPQRIVDPKLIDELFDLKTKTLSDFQRAALRRRWATMPELLSSTERKRRIIASILQDFDLKPRLNNDRGTAILVSPSIRDACEYFREFQNTRFRKNVGIITSFEPKHGALSKESVNNDEFYKYETYKEYVLIGWPNTTSYEAEMKRRFINEPARTKILIVVSMLLTGFDAPSCTYIYIDDFLKNHTLFQAICRTNRLDGDDKEYGYIVDFKEIFSEIQNAVLIYNSDDLYDDGSDEGNGNIEIKDWLNEGKFRLDTELDALHHLCEGVRPPKEIEQYLNYFCGEVEDWNALREKEPLRVLFYKSVIALLRAYSSISQNLDDAGYTESEQADLIRDVKFYTELRSILKKYSGDDVDIKPYEADMRHLLNTYIEADPAQTLGTLSDGSFTQAVKELGMHQAISSSMNEKDVLSTNSVAEGIIHNIRQRIFRNHLENPRFYEKMSQLLEDLIGKNRQSSEDYKEFLKIAEKLMLQVMAGEFIDNAPEILSENHEAIVIFDNLSNIPTTTFRCPDDQIEIANLSLKIDKAVRDTAQSHWRGDVGKERAIKNAIYPILNFDGEATIAMFNIIKNQRGYE